MGMPPRELICDSLSHVMKVESPSLPSQLRVKDYLDENIAEFFLEVRPVLVINGFEDLMDFLDQVGLQRAMILLKIPRASGFRVAELSHDFEQT